jgi:hypothetical protein
MSLKDDLLAYRDRKVEQVAGEWPTVFVRSLSVRDSLALEAAMRDGGENTEAATAAQLAAFLSDPEGNALLTQAEAAALLDRSAVMVKAILEAGRRLNGWEGVKGN